MIQTYSNPLGTLTGRCKYMFPVPATAAVCAFHMETSDGRIVEGVAKDREVAQREYESAVRANQLAGLINYATNDSRSPWSLFVVDNSHHVFLVFTISIGSIPARTTVKVYVEVCFARTI